VWWGGEGRGGGWRREVGGASPATNRRTAQDTRCRPKRCQRRRVRRSVAARGPLGSLLECRCSSAAARVSGVGGALWGGGGTAPGPAAPPGQPPVLRPLVAASRPAAAPRSAAPPARASPAGQPRAVTG